MARSIPGAFAEAGFDQLRFELKTVAPRFSEAEWLAIHREATAGSGSGQEEFVPQDPRSTAAPASEPMPGEGHGAIAQPGHRHYADARPASGEGQKFRVREDHVIAASPARDPSPLPDGGHLSVAQQGHMGHAAIRNPASGSGHVSVAQQGQPVNAAPAREPSAADWNRRINLNAAIAKSAFVTRQLGGKSFGDVRPSELKRIERTGLSDAIAARLVRQIGTFTTDDPMRQQMSEKQAADLWVQVDANLQSRRLQNSMKRMANG